nr:MAG TPA: hypothetical protein [Caudoviricetes sp.]
MQGIFLTKNRQKNNPLIKRGHFLLNYATACVNYTVFSVCMPT